MNTVEKDHPDLPEVKIEELPNGGQSVEIRPKDLINPMHLAFKKELVAVLLENTKNVRDKLKGAGGLIISPALREVIKSAQAWSRNESDYIIRMFGGILDEMTKSPVGTWTPKLAANGGSKRSHHFAPLTVIVPMKAHDGHEYMLRTPYIIIRVEGENVLCIPEGGMTDATWLNVAGSKSLPASDEEVRVCVETLNPIQLTELLTHEYLRPVLHKMMGVGLDGDEEEESPTPPDVNF